MKIILDNLTYHVSFRNRSEKIVHDQMPVALFDPLASLLFERVVPKPPKPGAEAWASLEKPVEWRMKKAYRPFLKLKPTKRISTTTTTCTISDETGSTLAVGKAYYSASEDYFDRMKARRKALGRALHEFDRARRTRFLAAYEAQFAERQAKAVRSREQATATPSSATTETVPKPVAAQQPHA